MQYRGFLRKGWVSLLILCLLCALLPAPPIPQAKAAGDLEVRLGGALIGNASHGAENTLINFQISTPGYTYSKNDDFNTDFSAGNIYLYNGDSITMTIRVAGNTLLQELARSGHTTVEYGWSQLVTTEDCGTLCIERDHQKTSGKIFVDNQLKIEDSSDTSSVGSKSGSAALGQNTVIRIEISGFGEDVGEPSGVRGLYVRFKDTTRPVLNAYSFAGDGAERMNPTVNQPELYVKENEYVNLTYKFSEPVRPTAIVPSFSDYFLRHPLFVNTDGTGLPAAGQQQYMQNITYTSATLNQLHSNISYQYTGVKYHQSGIPVTPKIIGTTGAISPIDLSLEEKLRQAVLADAAGNIATIDFTHRAGDGSNETIKGKAVDPFDYDHGGYRVIVDAVAPKYTKTGNGIQPEILTGVVLNDNDKIEFTVQFTEEVIPERIYNTEDTYLHFNNGMKAKYQSGSGTDRWKFQIELDKDQELETPLLKAIALTHSDKQTDTMVLRDYAGNLLIQPANYDGIHIDGDESLLNSKIDWANLSIDNTAPDISFRFESGGATSTLYEKNGKATIDANDPNLLVPPLDPVNPGLFRPSKGIYRPSNMTGSASPAVGLVYYFWSQSPANPLQDKEDDHYAAVKRYALSAKQPREELYPGELAEFDLLVANNKTNMIAPPAKALLPENSGPWYLHAWTADMTWDSARELMQYEKMKTYIQEYPEKYEAWKQELPDDASEQDRIFHADTKALAAVGQYGDLSVWPLSDFKQDDSNWSYAVTPFLLDNQAPSFVFEEIRDNQTAEVKVEIAVADAHSGVSRAHYQFVKDGDAPGADWTEMALTDGRQTVSTLNKVVEDGVYYLHVKAVDKAGNESSAVMDRTVTVDSTSTVRGSFSPDANPNYVPSHDISFKLSGMTPTENQVFYAITNSSARPADGSPEYKTVTAVTSDVYGESVTEEVYGSTVTEEVYGAGSGELWFTIPADPAKNGIQYVHVVAEPADRSRLYTFMKTYYFDNEPPSVTFSRTGSEYPRDRQEVTATVAEQHSTNGLIQKYQWVKGDSPVPDAASAEWLDWPENGRAVITNETLSPGETADFRLYVFAQDGAGNAVIAATDPFRVSKVVPEAPPAPGESSLLYVYENGAGSYTAILKLGLEAADKTGYQYSMSPDGGQSWSRWRPYTNFVSVEVPTDQPQLMQIQVKYRTPGGLVGEALPLTAEELPDIEPVYALASVNTMQPVRPDVGVEIAVEPALGIRVQPSAANPSEPVRIGNSNTFRVTENGYYSFDLTDVTDSERKDTLFIVIGNVDGVAPGGEVELLSTQPTNQSVSVKLIPSEPVRILNNDGRDVYTFTENGTFTFEFADEAGNVGAAPVTVDFIRKEAPQVRIVKSYQYGQNADEVFGTIRDGSNNVIAASGVVLTVEKATPEAEDFFVPGGERSVVLRENGKVSFIVSDLYGNTAKVEETVTNIVTAAPEPEQMQYTYVDESGNPLPPEKIVTIGGQQYAKGKLQVTMTGRTTPGNIVFSGTKPVEAAEGQYANRISDESGAFQLVRTFEGNGTLTVALTDLMGNSSKIPVSITGLDNTAPEIVLNHPVAAVTQSKPGFDFRTDLGGFTVSDNVSAAENIVVTISEIDWNKPGERQSVTYTAVDQAGNTATAVQDVFVTGGDGMLLFANGLLISGSTGESALFDTNRLTFNVQGYNAMDVEGTERINERGTYDVLYYTGLYREGQMKYIAEELSYEELLKQNFTVAFPDKGWYTIIVRNQERERIYSTFFVSKTE